MFRTWFQSVAHEVVEDFYGQLAQLPKSRRVLEMLSPEELKHLKARQGESLISLAANELSPEVFEATARHVGWIHAVVGVDSEELIQVQSLIGASTNQHMVWSGFHDPEADEFEKRLIRDLTWQLKAYQDLEQTGQHVLQRITKVAWGARSYVDLINSVVSILIAHKPIGACAIGRPDAEGIFHFEAAAPQGPNSYYSELLSGGGSRITVHADQPGGQGPTGRAWREGRTERIINFAMEPQAAPWREIAARQGLRSCIAIPLGSSGQQPLAILLVHSRLPGGFTGLQQQAFFEMVRTLMDSAFARLDEVGGIHAATPFTARNHFAALVRSDALQMYYQPILDLKTWHIPKVESLVRLWDGDRLLGPGQFLEVLNGDDLLEVFVRGLNQSLSDRRRWLQGGNELDISINLPPAALGDVRYYDAICTALTEYECPAASLTLEVLENQTASLSLGRQTLLDSYRSLGVMLAQDDLGAGQSGLSRLRQLPFDLIKIDRDMATIDEANPLPTLRLIYQLTRLGHALGKRVLVEGVEHENWLAALALLGVDTVQGYAVSKPMPEPEFAVWIAERKPEHCEARLERAVPVRLAKLLVWNERLVLNYPLLRKWMSSTDTTAMGESLYEELTSLRELMPLTPAEAYARQELLEVIHATGLNSQSTELAYRNLASAILQGQPAAEDE